MPTFFDITLKKNEIVRLFKEIDQDEDAIIKFGEFRDFFEKDYEKELADLEKKQDSASIQFEIFDHIIKVLKQKNLTLAEVFDQIDTNKNGFLEVDEFSNLLERLGFTISEQQVFEILRQMDENFDGRISYNELAHHVNKLGFQLSLKELHGHGKKVEQFTWRDKSIETIILAVNKVLDQSTFEEYFA